MKRKIISVLLLICLLATGVSAQTLNADRAYNWYCMKTKSGCQPPLPSEFSFINELGGYYLDADASDNDKVIYLTFDATH